jgi:hypothetical protein
MLCNVSKSAPLKPMVLMIHTVTCEVLTIMSFRLVHARTVDAVAASTNGSFRLLRQDVAGIADSPPRRLLNQRPPVEPRKGRVETIANFASILLSSLIAPKIKVQTYHQRLNLKDSS